MYSTGTVSGTISYGDYGNVVKTTGTIAKTPFKYAGQYGAITDDNGLVYLKTRYYNPQLMRFMNRDTVAGSITDSQSLNRFSYVEGNPLTYVDLNGQARTWLSSYNGLHSMLDVLGFMPVLGNVTALVSIGLDIATGNYDAIMADAMGLLPMGHILGAVGGVAIAHFATPALTHLLAHSAVLKSGLIAGGVRKIQTVTTSKQTKTAVEYGEQYLGKSKSTSKLKPNVSFTHPNGTYSETDELGRLSYVHQPDVKVIKGSSSKRNGVAQRTAGWEDRLDGDNGGHMLAHTFGGSPDIDNLVAQNAKSNQRGAWRQMEKDIAQEVNNGSSVDFEVNINYDGNSLRPSYFDTKYTVDNSEIYRQRIENEANY